LGEKTLQNDHVTETPDGCLSEIITLAAINEDSHCALHLKQHSPPITPGREDSSDLISQYLVFFEANVEVKSVILKEITTEPCYVKSDGTCTTLQAAQLLGSDF